MRGRHVDSDSLRPEYLWPLWAVARDRWEFPVEDGSTYTSRSLRFLAVNRLEKPPQLGFQRLVLGTLIEFTDKVPFRSEHIEAESQSRETEILRKNSDLAWVSLDRPAMAICCA